MGAKPPDLKGSFAEGNLALSSSGNKGQLNRKSGNITITTTTTVS